MAKLMHLWIPASGERPRVIEVASAPIAAGEVYAIKGALSANDARDLYALAKAFKGGEPPEGETELVTWAAQRDARKRVTFVGRWLEKDGSLVSASDAKE